MLIKFTHVDALTGLPVTQHPAANGPRMPSVKGLTVDFSNKSEWPTSTPIFHGHCADDADVHTPGILGTLTDMQFEQARASEMESRSKKMRSKLVDGIVVETTSGLKFDGDEISQGRIARAIIAMQASSTATTPWVLADNTHVDVTLNDLIDALSLAGAEQSRIWIETASLA